MGKILLGLMVGEILEKITEEPVIQPFVIRISSLYVENNHGTNENTITKGLTDRQNNKT